MGWPTSRPREAGDPRADTTIIKLTGEAFLLDEEMIGRSHWILYQRADQQDVSIIRVWTWHIPPKIPYCASSVLAVETMAQYRSSAPTMSSSYFLRPSSGT